MVNSIHSLSITFIKKIASYILQTLCFLDLKTLLYCNHLVSELYLFLIKFYNHSKYVQLRLFFNLNNY